MASITGLRPKKNLMPHQDETVLFQLDNKRAYNLSACGSGKTLPAVEAIKLLYNGGAEERILVIAPMSVIGTTWLEHIEEHAPELPLMLMDVSSRRAKQVKELPAFKGVVIINPDGLAGVHRDLVNWRPGLVVVDELSGYYRNMRTRRWKALATLLHICRSACWAFTGTPITNHLMDSYAQCLLVNPGMLPRSREGRAISFVQYRDMLCFQPYPGVWAPKPGAVERVHGFMQPAIRFTREQVMGDIKEPIRLRKHVSLTPEQQKALNDMIATGKAEFGGEVINAKAVRALVTKLVQITTGTVYGSKGQVVELPYGPRLQALLDLHEEVEYSPVIVAAPFIHTINRLEADLTKQGMGVAVIIGDTTPATRKEIVIAFQRGDYDFLLCHPQTLAHGVTMTASHTVCWFGPLYDLELYAQLNDRIFRYGQKGQPLVVELCSTKAEAEVYASLRNKEHLAVKFLDLFGG